MKKIMFRFCRNCEKRDHPNCHYYCHRYKGAVKGLDYTTAYYEYWNTHTKGEKY